MAPIWSVIHRLIMAILLEPKKVNQPLHMPLTQRFLRARHWQLFVLTFGLPFLLQFILMSTMIGNFGREKEPNISFVPDFFGLFVVILLLVLVTQFGWYWSVAIGLQPKVPANVRLKVRKFKVFFFIPLSYMLTLFLGFAVFMIGFSGLAASDEEPSFTFFATLFGIIFPLHFFSIFCIFYCLYFIAKTLKTIELQRETTFSDFSSEFFLLWFFFIGIWILQPRINALAAGTSPPV